MSLISKPDINRISSELKSIASLIGPGKSYSMLLEGDGSVAAIQLPLKVVMNLVPDKFHKCPGAEYADDTVVTICIEKLFDQLDEGLISTPLENLLFDIADFYLGEVTPAQMEEPIGIPRQLVLDALWAS
ncbi:MAG: hypothetical protein ACI9TH_003413 [Kiritimatiellia bacterium]|jgi:hypothetical protein